MNTKYGNIRAKKMEFWNVCFSKLLRKWVRETRRITEKQKKKNRKNPINQPQNKTNNNKTNKTKEEEWRLSER